MDLRCTFCPARPLAPDGRLDDKMGVVKLFYHCIKHDRILPTQGARAVAGRRGKTGGKRAADWAKWGETGDVLRRLAVVRGRVQHLNSFYSLESLCMISEGINFLVDFYKNRGPIGALHGQLCDKGASFPGASLTEVLLYNIKLSLAGWLAGTRAGKCALATSPLTFVWWCHPHPTVLGRVPASRLCHQAPRPRLCIWHKCMGSAS